jgi:hypothetical protein
MCQVSILWSHFCYLFPKNQYKILYHDSANIILMVLFKSVKLDKYIMIDIRNKWSLFGLTSLISASFQRFVYSGWIVIRSEPCSLLGMISFPWRPLPLLTGRYIFVIKVTFTRNDIKIAITFSIRCRILSLKWVEFSILAMPQNIGTECVETG